MTRLKALRKARNFSQIKMQMLTGIDQSDYSKIETGERGMSFEQCRRSALALDTSMDYLAGLTDDPAPYPRRPACQKSGCATFLCKLLLRSAPWLCAYGAQFHTPSGENN